MRQRGRVEQDLQDEREDHPHTGMGMTGAEERPLRLVEHEPWIEARCAFREYPEKRDASVHDGRHGDQRHAAEHSRLTGQAQAKLGMNTPRGGWRHSFTSSRIYF